MKAYKVTITETLRMEVTVDASSLAEAEGMVESDWNDEKYVLDASHFAHADFRAEPMRRERSYER